MHAAFDAILMVSNAVGAVGSAAVLFLGLFFFMAFKSKKRFEEHLATDATRFEEPVVLPDDVTQIDNTTHEA